MLCFRCLLDVTQHFVYHAPARHVPLPNNVEREIQRGFLNLFRRAEHPEHNHDVAQEDLPEECKMYPIDNRTIDVINELAPKKAQISGFNQQHARANAMLTKEFMSKSRIQQSQ